MIKFQRLSALIKSYLRERLLQILAEQYIFPTTENNAAKCKPKSISLDLFYSCCELLFLKDAAVENKQIAECGSSRKWFHRMCKGIPREIFEDESIE